MEQVINQRIQRWLDFMSMDCSPGSVFQISLDDRLTRPFPGPHNITERLDWSRRKYDQYMANLSWLDDDRIPSLQVHTGTEIFAEAFGSKVFRPDDNMPFAKPFINDAGQAGRIKIPELSTSPLAVLFDLADRLRDYAGPKALLQIPDVQSPLDIAALIWEKTDFYVAMIEEPEAVLELMDKIKTLLLQFFDIWFNRYGRDYIAHYPYYFMRGGFTLSEDEVGSISGDMFNVFALPDLVELSNRYGGLGMHCCANARHQWDNFKKIPGLRLLNLVQPEEIIRQANPFFASHTCQMHSWLGNGEPWTWPSQHLPSERVVYDIPAKTKEEALQITERIRQAMGRQEMSPEIGRESR
jgi:hypothetical protein